LRQTESYHAFSQGWQEARNNRFNGPNGPGPGAVKVHKKNPFFAQLIKVWRKRYPAETTHILGPKALFNDDDQVKRT
jgi:hypothetical protein